MKEPDKRAQFMVRVEPEKGDAFKASIKKRGQSVQFILEKAINTYIEETKSLESSGQL